MVGLAHIRLPANLTAKVFGRAAVRRQPGYAGQADRAAAQKARAGNRGDAAQGINGNRALANQGGKAMGPERRRAGMAGRGKYRRQDRGIGAAPRRRDQRGPVVRRRGDDPATAGAPPAAGLPQPVRRQMQACRADARRQAAVTGDDQQQSTSPALPGQPAGQALAINGVVVAEYDR